MTKVLITGGAGFIGANLVAHLTKAGGYEITVLDNESLGKREHLGDDPVRFVKGDILDEALLHRELEGMDAIVHLAADTRVLDSIKDPSHNFENNVVGSFRLFCAARRAGIKRIVSASTGGAIMGEVEPPVHEGMVPQPLSPYGASKLAMEGYASCFNGAYGMSTACVRFSNVYGPRSFHKGSVVAHFMKQIIQGQELVVYGDGSQTRDYLFVGDLALGVESALKSDGVGAFQLGSGEPTDLNELIELIRQAVGDAYPIKVRYEDFRKGEVVKTWCDVSKAKRELGFATPTSLAAGIQQTWQWFLSQSEG